MCIKNPGYAGVCIKSKGFLQRTNLGGLRTLGTIIDFKLNCLTFVKAAITATFDR